MAQILFISIGYKPVRKNHEGSNFFFKITNENVNENSAT